MKTNNGTEQYSKSRKFVNDIMFIDNKIVEVRAIYKHPKKPLIGYFDSAKKLWANISHLDSDPDNRDYKGVYFTLNKFDKSFFSKIS